MTILAIDIGGTNIKYALCDSDGNLRNKGSKPTEACKGAHFMMGKVEEIINEHCLQYGIEGIAISSAGQIDADLGRVVFATDAIPLYTGFEIKKHLEQKYLLPVTVENDVNCAALGEVWKGNINSNSFIAITIGTGIGGAIVENGCIYYGSGYSAGEFGHIPLIYNGLHCDCGHKGCYEKYASTKALELQIEDGLGFVETIEFFQECKQGNKEYVWVFNQWIDYLSEGLRGIVHILNPSLILIGGGISKQGEFLEKAVEKSLWQKIMPSYRKKLAVRTMTLGNDANLLGAVYYHLKQRSK